MKRKRSDHDDGDSQSRRAPQFLHAQHQAPSQQYLLTPKSTPTSPSSDTVPKPTSSTSPSLQSSIEHLDDDAARIIAPPSSDQEASEHDASFPPLRNSLLPSPPCHIYTDAYDPSFGQQVRDAYAASLLCDGWRVHQYGVEVADVWKRGSTPEEAREQWEAREQAMQASAEDWSSDEEDETPKVDKKAAVQAMGDAGQDWYSMAPPTIILVGSQAGDVE